MEISGTSPLPTDAFQLVTYGIDHSEHLLGVDCIVQNDPAMTIAQFHHLEHQAEPGHRRACPAAARSVCVAALPNRLIGPTAPVETLVSSTTL
jgi:hypothetical protein